MFGEKARFQGLGMIEVDLCTSLCRQMGEVAIVRVVLDDLSGAHGHRLGEFLGDGRLSRSGASGDTDAKRFRTHKGCRYCLERRALTIALATIAVPAWPI